MGEEIRRNTGAPEAGRQDVRSDGEGHQGSAWKEGVTPLAPEPPLVFDAGCQWIGTFVKRAHQGYRSISFHLATHVVVNCLPPNSAMPGPLGTVQSNDGFIE